MIHKKRVVLTIFVNLLVEVINKVAPLLILHIAQKRLGVERFGYAQFGISMVDLLFPFIVFGYNAMGSVKVGAAKDNPSEVGRLISEIIGLRLVHGLIAFVLLMGATFLIPAYEQYRTIALALSFSLFFTCIDLTHVHLGTQKMIHMGIFMGTAKILSLIGIFYFVEDKQDAIIYAALTLGANALVSFWTFLYGAKKYPLRIPAFDSAFKLFKTSLPFASVLLLMMIIERFDVFVANAFYGNVGSGFYAGPARIAQSLYSAFSAVAIIFFSEMVIIKDKESFTKHLRLGFWAVYMLIAPAMAGIWFVDEDIITFIMGDQYFTVGTLLSILVFGMGAHGLIVVFGMQVLILREKFKSMTLSLLLGFLIGVVLSYFFGSRFGLKGIGWSIVAGKTVAGVMIVYFSREHLTSLPWKEFHRIAYPACFMFFGLLFLDLKNFFATVFVGAVLFLGAAAVANHQNFKILIQMLKARTKSS